MPLLNPDRLFPADHATRTIARRLYDEVAHLPIISPHGHTQAAWFRSNQPFPDPATLFVQPDHYIYRMLYSQGVPMEQLSIGEPKVRDPRALWRSFAANYHLFRGTPTRLWLDFALSELFGIEERLAPANADRCFDAISEKLATPEFLPRALFDRFQIALLSTTDSPLDTLDDHLAIRKDNWKGKILPTFRPDPVVDPDFAGFAEGIAKLGEMTGEVTSTWTGYLAALRKSRQRFIAAGCKATDHGHPTARTADLDPSACVALFAKVLGGGATVQEKELFRAQMLTEMAAMSLEDGLVMQIHPGAWRNHNDKLFHRWGRDIGADIPSPTNYVDALRPLLSRFGNESTLTIILFTLDETNYSRELAPLAGHYPCLRLGPPWWFHDSPEGMLRYREQVTETAGFYNTVGFNDDTRAFLSIPARHDVARRMDSVFLARLVAEHRIEEDEAHELIYELTHGLVRRAYHLEDLLAESQQG